MFSVMWQLNGFAFILHDALNTIIIITLFCQLAEDFNMKSSEMGHHQSYIIILLQYSEQLVLDKKK